MQNITSSTSFLAPPPYRQIRARYDSETVRVYQAYRPEIADAAVAAGRFVPPFSLDRMTWIKPSFLWMMYRCGWATKPGQERVLAVDITREGFEWALSHSCLSLCSVRRLVATNLTTVVTTYLNTLVTNTHLPLPKTGVEPRV